MARGDLNQKITGVSVSVLSWVNTINDMIDQLAGEVKKVAHEAEVGNAQGIWQEITCVIILPGRNDRHLTDFLLNARFTRQRVEIGASGSRDLPRTTEGHRRLAMFFWTVGRYCVSTAHAASSAEFLRAGVTVAMRRGFLTRAPCLPHITSRGGGCSSSNACCEPRASYLVVSSVPGPTSLIIAAIIGYVLIVVLFSEFHFLGTPSSAVATRELNAPSTSRSRSPPTSY